MQQKCFKYIYLLAQVNNLLFVVITIQNLPTNSIKKPENCIDPSGHDGRSSCSHKSCDDLLFKPQIAELFLPRRLHFVPLPPLHLPHFPHSANKLIQCCSFLMKLSQGKCLQMETESKPHKYLAADLVSQIAKPTD